MPQSSLAVTVPTPADTIYLDTSAVMTLAQGRGLFEGLPVPQEAPRRLKVLVPFLVKAKAAGAALRTSILSVEELAAATRNQKRASEAQSRGYTTWRQFKSRDPGASAVADATAKANMLQMMKFAVNALELCGVQIQCVGAVGDSIVAARARRKAHKRLLDRHVEIDSMDALHIVFGTELGATGFISFDTGWGAVPSVRTLGL